ncbi:MAG: GNAT family N-acetyltransferase [Saprospiraceae bacterium]|nr:GNAT family N-acetyltransferase [Saprospiraceae bacterium]
MTGSDEETDLFDLIPQYMNFILETERFGMRAVVEDDAPDFYELDSDPLVHRYLGNKPVDSIEVCKAVIQNLQRQYREIGFGRWAVIDKMTGEFVGWCGLKYERNIRKDRPYNDIGYRLKSKHWGKGIASETASACLKYGFEQLKMEEICAAAHIENTASQHVLIKIGLTWVESFEFDGQTCHWFTLSRADWQDRQTG